MPRRRERSNCKNRAACARDAGVCVRGLVRLLDGDGVEVDDGRVDGEVLEAQAEHLGRLRLLGILVGGDIVMVNQT